MANECDYFSFCICVQGRYSPAWGPKVTRAKVSKQLALIQRQGETHS